ncbi:MAG: hypothetical protein SH808_00920 [Saprospiraceae bacterium]|nr:hypothetical protein [Saprospiraceae bacterium]
MHTSSYHSFHIPVMGLAFTIDSPIKVARFGISSVISIMEDRLVEMMRSYYYPTLGREYKPISTHEEDYRAKRITDYLNLVQLIVQTQVEKLRNSAFESGSEIVKYFEMLPEDSKIKQVFRQMTHTKVYAEKEKAKSFLRTQIVPGSIDVNIMTKIDNSRFSKDGRMLEDGSDAVAALRGYAQSDLSNSSIIFSAGMNPRLYNYLEKCIDFKADENGQFKKKVIIKVSDYRSALIQGKYLAKKGIWVSEFRIESGLNCGGHAFATDGYLMGPILEEFKAKKEELISTVFTLYQQAILLEGGKCFSVPPPLKITAQGGIGTFEEDHFLHTQYGIDSTGWGTPFLLVPEATTVDEATLKLLCSAKKEDVVLGHNSPLGVRFHYLKGTTADKEKHDRIHQGKPGSPCTEKLLVMNTEFTEQPICTASHKYQKLKIAQLQSLSLPDEEYKKQLTHVLDKECLCLGLSNAAARVYNMHFIKKLDAVTICPGPNIAYFNKVVSLQTMTDHIYGRTNIIEDQQRPHMFIAELKLYIQYFKEQLEQDARSAPDAKRKKYLIAFCTNIRNGMAHYRQIAPETIMHHDLFGEMLESSEKALDELNTLYSVYEK